MKKTLVKQSSWIKIGILSIILLYLINLLFNYFYFDFDKNFGYLDYQLFWQNLSNLADGKIIYRDFFWEYGILYLIIGLPFFLLLKKTFLASIFIRLIILPVVGICLSFLLAKEFLKKIFLLLFFLLLFLYGVNNDYTSLRHLLPELGLVILFVGLGKSNQRKITLGSFLIGLSLTSSVEYGIAAIISVAVYFLIVSFGKQLKSVSKQIFRFSSIVTLVAAPYFFFLWKAGALKNFITFTIEYARSFYYNSPCRELFPRLNEISLNLQRLNLYFVPFVLVFLLGWAISKRKAKWFSVIVSLLIYSFLIFYRVFSTPCVGYLNYGLTFLFLILVYALSQSKPSSKFRLVVLLIITWFLIIGFSSKADEFLALYKARSKVSETKILPIAGVKLKKKLTHEYQEIINFVKENSKNNDYLYVYPNGPYNQLAERESPVSTISTWYYDLAPSLTEITHRQLSQKKPKLVIINIYNARSLKSALNNVSYNVHSEDKDIIFEGLTTSVENFISQNYEIAKKFKIAWVLVKREQAIPLKKIYLPTEKKIEWQIATQGLNQNPYLTINSNVNYKVIRNNPLIQIGSASLNEVELIKIPIKVDLGMKKIFSKFIISIYAKNNKNKFGLLNQQIATADWQDVWILFPETEGSTNINSIVISISNNRGFFWWGKPNNIELKELKLFIRNQKLEINDSAF